MMMWNRASKRLLALGTLWLLLSLVSIWITDINSELTLDKILSMIQGQINRESLHRTADLTWMLQARWTFPQLRQ